MSEPNLLSLKQYEIMAIESFLPSPQEILKDLIDDSRSTAQLGLIHGSYIYMSSNGVPCATYSDTRVYDGKRFIESRLSLVHQRPDIDAIMIVKDRKAFTEVFSQYCAEKNLKERLAYFFTMNVVTADTVFEEIRDPGSAAIKRILAFRPVMVTGDQKLFGNLIHAAKANVKPHDHEFQLQYDARKKLFRLNAMQGMHEFVITRKEYKTEYPMLLKSFEGKLNAEFPTDRDKIVLPHSMRLKKRIDLADIDKSALELI